MDAVDFAEAADSQGTLAAEGLELDACGGLATYPAQPRVALEQISYTTKGVRGLQCVLVRALAEREYEADIQLAIHDWKGRDATRLRSAGGRDNLLGAALAAAPTRRTVRLRDAEYRCGARRRLGIEEYVPELLQGVPGTEGTKETKADLGIWAAGTRPT